MEWLKSFAGLLVNAHFPVISYRNVTYLPGVLVQTGE